MARNDNRRVNSRSDRYERYIYEGNTVRKLQAIPQEKPEQKPVSRTARKNRAKARRMSRGYVMFLAVISTAALFMCVRYLQLKSVITTQTKEIAGIESNLSQLKADNDALYNSVLASVDLEYIKKVAMDQLEMNYPQEDQIYQFDTAGNSYVRQYQNVPDAE
jgi:cell division protein FtsL